MQDTDGVCHHTGWIQWNREKEIGVCEQCGQEVPTWKINNA